MDKVFCVPKYVTVKSKTIRDIKKKTLFKMFPRRGKNNPRWKILKFMSYNLPEMWTQEVEFLRKENNSHS